MTIRNLHPDFVEFLSLLKRHGARFLVVGGYAIAATVRHRHTDDLDVLVDPSKRNSHRVAAVLAELGYAELARVVPEHLAVADRMVSIGRRPVRIDILSSIVSVKFSSAWKRRTEITIGGMSVPFIGREDLLANKRAAGRPQDLKDVETIERFSSPKRTSSHGKQPKRRS